MKLHTILLAAAVLTAPASAAVADAPAKMTVAPKHQKQQAYYQARRCYARVYRACMRLAPLPGRNQHIRCVRKARRKCGGLVQTTG